MFDLVTSDPSISKHFCKLMTDCHNGMSRGSVELEPCDVPYVFVHNAVVYTKCEIGSPCAGSWTVSEVLEDPSFQK